MKNENKKQRRKTEIQIWESKREMIYLRMMASTKVKAGVRLLKAEARVGELYSIPLYAHMLAENLPHSFPV